MAHHLHHGEKAVDVLMLFDIGHLLCRHDDIQDLDDLGRLDADAGEANPGAVAGAVVLAEDDERREEQDVDDAEDLPLGAEDVRVDDREQHKGPDAEKHREDLHRDIFGGGRHVPAARHHAGDGPVHHQDAEDGAERAEDEQEDIRPLKKLFYIGSEGVDRQHRLS